MTTSLLHISDGMDALDALRPSMFADITVSAVERLTVYCRNRTVRSCLMCWKNSQIIKHCLIISQRSTNNQLFLH